MFNNERQITLHDGAILYLDLDDALENIAKRSFHEDAEVSPVREDAGDVVGWIVGDTETHQTDEWTWTYDKDVLHRDSVSETTRLFEPAESWNEAWHVRRGLPYAVEALESGACSVSFAYAVVDMDPSELEYDPDGDNAVGWIVIADGKF